jgi:protein-disulfide isomerase
MENGVKKILLSLSLAATVQFHAANADDSYVSDLDWSDMIYDYFYRPDENKTYINDHYADFYFDSDSPVLGNLEGTKPIVIFTDYNCRHCKNLDETLAYLMLADRQIKIIVKEYPIMGADSQAMALLSVAAYKMYSSDIYEMVRREFFHRDEELTKDYIHGVADRIGIDGDAWVDYAFSPEVEAEVQQTNILANDLYLTGTPATIFKDYVKVGALTPEELVNIFHEGY